MANKGKKRRRTGTGSRKKEGDAVEAVKHSTNISFSRPGGAVCLAADAGQFGSMASGTLVLGNFGNQVLDSAEGICAFNGRGFSK